MPKTYTINNKAIMEIVEARKRNHDKQVEKRLHAVQLRGEGKRNAEIAEQLETSSDMISRWVSWYAKGGLEALLPKKREAHRRANRNPRRFPGSGYLTRQSDIHVKKRKMQ